MTDSQPGTEIELHPDYPHIDKRGHRDSVTRAWEEKWCYDRRKRDGMEWRDIVALYNDTYAPATIGLDTVFQRAKDFSNKILAEASGQLVQTVQDSNARTHERQREKMKLYEPLRKQAARAVKDMNEIQDALLDAVGNEDFKVVEALSKALVALGAINSEALKVLDSAQSEEKILIATGGWQAPKETKGSLQVSGSLGVAIDGPDDELDELEDEASEAEERVAMAYAEMRRTQKT